MAVLRDPESPFFDPAAEAPADWQADQDSLVREAVAYAAGNSSEVAARLAAAGVVAADVRGVADLARIPVLAKDDLPALQAADPPFGGMLAVPVGDLHRIYTSPGPILDPEGAGPDFWRMAPALWAAGFRAGQVVLNTFSYHLTPGGMMLDAGLRAIGCVVVPGGVGNTEAQIDLALAAGATGYVGTPAFLLTLLQRAVAAGTPLGIERATVTGGPFFPTVRAEVEGTHGVAAFEAYGTADAGALGYQCEERRGWHVAPGVVIEIVDPASGQPAPTGETGEVVVTSPNPVYPLVRFGTGDLSAFLDEGCSCGRTTPRLAGFLGRVGEGVKVKGMFVHPGSISKVVGSRPEVGRFRAVVRTEGHDDRLVVQVEPAEEGDGSIDDRTLADELRIVLKVGAVVEVVPTGSLPEGGSVLSDER